MLIAVTVILLILAALLLLVILGAVFFTLDSFFELPYVATKKEKLETIFKFADIKKVEDPEQSRRRETVIDLGSGDGRLLFKSAQLGARAIGYEINPFLVFITRVFAKFKDLSKLVTVKKENLWKANLKEADVIFVYGRKKTMQKFEDFVYKNAKKGARIVVNTNPFPNKKPLKSENKIFLYRI